MSLEVAHSHGPGDGEFNPYEQYDSEENRKAYEIQQRQRAMERRIRDSKRQCIGLKEAVDKAGTPEGKALAEKEYQKQAALLQKRNEAYNDFCKENDLKKQNERLSIAQWDRKQAAQARAAAREAGKDHTEKSDIIGIGTPKADLSYIRSESYKQKFSRISDNQILNQAIYKYSKAAIINQSGKLTENLTILTLDGKHIATTASKTAYETLYTDELKQKVYSSDPYSLISIHNHGTNIPPSGSDLASAGEKRYAFGIVACNDGKLYYYSTRNARPFLPALMDKLVDKYRQAPYNNSKLNAYERALDDLADNFGIEWRELK